MCTECFGAALTGIPVVLRLVLDPVKIDHSTVLGLAFIYYYYPPFNYAVVDVLVDVEVLVDDVVVVYALRLISDAATHLT